MQKDPRALRCVLLAITSVGFALLCHAPALAETYYVSPTGSDSTGDGTSDNPFATIEKARDTIRSINMTQDITVFLYGGRYELANTVVFDEQDKG